MSEISVSNTDALASPFDSIKLPGERWSTADLEAIRSLPKIVNPLRSKTK
jgi:hypothetical protein